MTQTTSPQAIEKATKRSWEDWLTFFKRIKAKELTHKEIAKKVLVEGVPGWWAQTVTVAYEQHIGRRVPGQDCDGEFAVSVGKTIDGTMDDALVLWVKLMKDRTELSDIIISRAPEVSKTDTWRYWRCGLADGSRVNVDIYQKAPGKAALSVRHEKLESSEQLEHWRTYWKELLAQPKR